MPNIFNSSKKSNLKPIKSNKSIKQRLENQFKWRSKSVYTFGELFVKYIILEIYILRALDN